MYAEEQIQTQNPLDQSFLHNNLKESFTFTLSLQERQLQLN